MSQVPSISHLNSARPTRAPRVPAAQLHEFSCGPTAAALRQRVTRALRILQTWTPSGPVSESLPGFHLPLTSEDALQRDRRSRRQGCADRGPSREPASSRVGPWTLAVVRAHCREGCGPRTTADPRAGALRSHSCSSESQAQTSRAARQVRLSALLHCGVRGSSLRRRVSDAPPPAQTPFSSTLRQAPGLPQRKRQGPSQQTPVRV